MPGSSVELNGVQVFEVPQQGPPIRTGQDAVDLMSAASEHRATLIAIPVERLGEEFFDLRTRIAGEVVQKFVLYGRRVAVVGDISSRMAESKSLAAWVAESNRGRDLWFVNNMQELADRLRRSFSLPMP